MTIDYLARLSPQITLALGIVVLVLGLFIGYWIGHVHRRLQTPKLETLARRDAVKRAGPVLTGQIAERFAPYFPNFAYDPADVRFLGTPVDFVVFKGLKNDRVSEIVFVEVKTGNATLTDKQRHIRDALSANAVRFEVYNPLQTVAAASPVP
jgi:predicted Holliday junction resolvase-like endonuclease